MSFAASAANTTELHFVDGDGQALGGVVVLAYQASGEPVPLKPGVHEAEMVQRNSTFDPHVLVVPQGARTQFPNKDKVRHHVYSFSPAKRFELELYKGVPSDPVIFDRDGIVVLGCNIHDQMKGFIVVRGTGLHGVSGEDGAARLATRPGTDLRFRVWHPRLPDAELQELSALNVTEAGAFVLDVDPPPPVKQPSLLQQRFNRFKKDP